MGLRQMLAAVSSSRLGPSESTSTRDRRCRKGISRCRVFVRLCTCQALGNQTNVAVEAPTVRRRVFIRQLWALWRQTAQRRRSIPEAMAFLCSLAWCWGKKSGVLGVHRVCRRKLQENAPAEERWQLASIGFANHLANRCWPVSSCRGITAQPIAGVTQSDATERRLWVIFAVLLTRPELPYPTMTGTFALENENTTHLWSKACRYWHVYSRT